MTATHQQSAAASWYQQITQGESYRTVAERAGIEHSALYKQVSRNRLPAETVIAISRAYGHPPVLGLIENGYLTTPEATSNE
ncbi:hypothetical protein [Nocardia sp. NPDC051832]|uniref:hypothetical protein n=1 Tax=Nocardia sp. NPDC051832 TaxID=3155673 RepID=UPI003414CE31